MENTPDSEKLLDLVCNTDQQETFNAITRTIVTSASAVDTVQTTDSPAVAANNGLKGIPDLSYDEPAKKNSIRSPVTPENVPSTTNTANVPVNSTPVGTQSEPVGHDTAMTTHEEEAAEALLALHKLPDMDFDSVDVNDNVNLMPIGAPSSSVDINPVQIKLGIDNINQAIEDLPEENQIKPPSQVQSSDSNEGPDINKSTPHASAEKKHSPLTSPAKGKLKVTKYGLKKSYTTKRSYKCQKCGRKERSVHDLIVV